jgi:cation diffusion facilitator family transporter
MSTGGGKRAIIAAFFANLGIAIAKFIGFIFTSSASMLAESIHSFADTGNQGLLLLGSSRARKEADEAHPFGYGRERYFWAFVVALVLFSLGSLFAIFEGIEKIRHPHELESIEWAIGILLFAMVLEGFSFRTAVVEANHVRGSIPMARYIRRAKEPELPVVLLEDAGALLGLVIALTAIITAKLTDDAMWDGVGTLCIGILLGAIAIVLAIEMKSLLIGEGASAEHLRAIEQAIDSSPDVERIIHLRTEHIGPDELLVGAKIAFTPGLTLDLLAAAIDDVERRVREVVPIARPFYIEPDILRTPQDTKPAET